MLVAQQRTGSSCPCRVDPAYRHSMREIVGSVVARFILNVSVVVIVAWVALALAHGNYAPQTPGCAWSFADREASASALPLPQCPFGSNPALLSRPLTVRYSKPLPLLLARAVGITLAPLTVAMLLALLVGIPIGVWATARPKSALARLARSLSAGGVALPGFMVSFGVVLASIWFVGRTGHRLIQFLNFQFDAGHMVMPTLALACAPAALIAQSTVAVLGSVYDQDYIRAARGRGIDGLRLAVGHVLPVAAASLIAVTAAAAQYTLGTIPILEYLFNWPGLGLIVLQAVEGQDRAALASGMALFALAFTGLGMIADRAGRLHGTLA